MSLGKILYLLTEDGKINRLKVDEIVLNQSVISKIAGAMVFGAPYVVPYNKDNEPLSICLRNNETILGARIKQLRLTTNYLLKDDYLYPCFQETSDSLKLTAIWQAPPSMELFFAIVCVGPPKEFSAQYINQSYLFARHTSPKKYGGLFKLPLSNLYDDGKLCLGESIKEVRASNYAATMDRAITILNNSNWNADLYPPNVEISKSLFRFNPTDMTQIPVDEPTWPKYCLKCSTIYTEAINNFL
jgi:hypothetical protein